MHFKLFSIASVYLSSKSGSLRADQASGCQEICSDDFTSFVEIDLDGNQGSACVLQTLYALFSVILCVRSPWLPRRLITKTYVGNLIDETLCWKVNSATVQARFLHGYDEKCFRDSKKEGKAVTVSRNGHQNHLVNARKFQQCGTCSGFCGTWVSYLPLKHHLKNTLTIL